MTGFEDFDWESAVAFAKRYGALLIAVLFALSARRKKKAAMEEEWTEPEPASDETVSEIQPIEPGVDASKLARQYSSGPE